MKSLPWQALQVLCDGRSIIDIPKLELQSLSEVHQFLMTYGYDLYEPSHLEQIWKFYGEACKFLSKTLGVEIPASLRNRAAISDFRILLLIASGSEDFSQSKHRAIVCALLRIMHVISHHKNDLRLKYIVKIRKQTIGRFEAHVQKTIQNGTEQLHLGFEQDKIPLVRFEKKEGKNQNSVLMKLLQKPETVAQEVYDHLGVRFITRTRAEAVLVASYLLDHHLISVANIIGSRCRNTLLLLQQFKKLYEAKTPRSEIEMAQLEESLDYPSGTFGADNPFSSVNYHALQFTCRPLIRIPVIRKGGIRAEVSFFFPMEVQILDEGSYLKSQKGDAKHSIYKQKQLEAVRKRVLKELDL